MYFVKYGTEYLHDPRVENYILLDLSLSAKENGFGYCDFTIYPTHPMYDKLREHDADNPITVYDDDILLFSGFIYELGKEFHLDGSVKCKGELAYLAESIVRPYSTLSNGYGQQPPTSVDGYFEWLISQHNSQVKENKRFTVGINQGGSLDTNNYIYRESVKYPTTWSELSEKLLDSLGGYIRTRHVGSERYIDYLSDWMDTNTQILDFGQNLTDYTQTDDSESIATFVLPLGAQMSSTEYSYDDGYRQTSDTTMDSEKEYYTKSDSGYTKVGDDVKSFQSGVTYYEYYETYDESNLSLTISALSDAEYSYDDGYRKSGDIIYSEEAVQKYGWIGFTYENSDITVRENLVSKSLIALKELVSPQRTIEIKAVDMHLVNPNIKPIRIGEYVRVRSKPHNLDSYFLCTSIDLDLNKPENSLYTFGTTFDTLTGEQNKQIKLLNESINKAYEKADQLTEQEKQNALAVDEALKTSKEAKEAAAKAVLIVNDEYATSTSTSEPPESGWSTDTPEWTPGLFIWRRTVSTYGDGHTETGSPSLMTGNNGQNGEDATTLRIESSRGNLFKNDSISTVLSVVIYRGSEEIRDSAAMKKSYGNTAYLDWKWQRIDDKSFVSIPSDDPRFSDDCFSFTLSPDDVTKKVSFMCKLIV